MSSAAEAGKEASPAVLQLMRRKIQLQRAKAAYLRTHQIERMYPDEGPYRRELYPRHMEFFEAQTEVHSILAMCGNGVGKTLGMGGYSTALHATGQYPAWWPGHRYTRGINIWAAGKTRETTRNIQQKVLLGPKGQFGTGLIPKDCIIDWQMRSGGGGAVDWVRGKHVSGTISTIWFKSYEQGAESFYGDNIDVIWLDEPVNMDIVSECVARTRDSEWGLVYITFTPLKGVNDTVRHFQSAPGSELRRIVRCGWDDVPHLSEAWKAQTLADTPEYLHSTRKDGSPSLGEGAVYRVAPELIKYDPNEIGKLPDHWRYLFAMDVGWNPTAALWGALDPDSDILYVYSEHYLGNQADPIHAQAIKARGSWIPGVGDAAGINNADGEQWIKKYRDDHGLDLELADKSVEPGIQEVFLRLTSGRLRVNKTLRWFFDEYVAYHRKDGKIVKEFDHLMDCLRYLVMGLGRAKTRIESQANEVSVAREMRFGCYAQHRRK